jgi:hypothetical protein
MGKSEKLHRRGFEIVVERDVERSDGRYSVIIAETNGSTQNRRTVTRLPAERLDAAQPALAEALRASGQPKTALKATRATPLPLDEEAGVRLALAVAAILGVNKPGRTTRLLDGVSRLSTEECFYWYAHTLGVSDQAMAWRRMKALRIFLAEE